VAEAAITIQLSLNSIIPFVLLFSGRFRSVANIKHKITRMENHDEKAIKVHITLIIVFLLKRCMFMDKPLNNIVLFLYDNVLVAKDANTYYSPNK